MLATVSQLKRQNQIQNKQAKVKKQKKQNKQKNTHTQKKMHPPHLTQNTQNLDSFNWLEKLTAAKTV